MNPAGQGRACVHRRQAIPLRHFPFLGGFWTNTLSLSEWVFRGKKANWNKYSFHKTQPTHWGRILTPSPSWNIFGWQCAAFTKTAFQRKLFWNLPFKWSLEAKQYFKSPPMILLLRDQMYYSPPPRNCFSTYIILPFLIFLCSLKWDSAPRVFWQGNIWGWERKGGTGVFYEWDSVCPSTSGHLLMLYYEPSLVQQTPPSGWIRGFIIVILKEGLIVV